MFGKMRTPLVALLLIGCAHGPSPREEDRAPEATWRDGISAWRKQREASIGGDLGWITLAGLAWLRPGENTLGAATGSGLALPVGRAPGRVGSIFLDGDRVRLEVAPGVPLLADGAPVQALPLTDDRDGKPTVLTLGSLTMFVLKRQDRYALRVKDREHPARRRFAGLVYYPLDPRLRVRAHLERAPTLHTLPVANVLGQVEPMQSAGVLRFSLDGVDYALEAVLEPGERDLFVLFKDRTAGHGTYPSGRFLYAPPPDEQGMVDLDFNRAFTPPCAFTPYATCPIPPKHNHLAREIRAGERHNGSHE